MASTRLPGKALLPLGGGHPLLWHVVSRVQQAKRLDGVVVATGTDSANDPIAAFCRSEGWPCFRGSEADVLDRFYLAALWHKADLIVRVSGDSPLVDPAVVDALVEMALRPGVSYATNTDPPTWPDGQDVEVCTADALHMAWLKAKLHSDREHVTPWIRRHLPPEQKRNLIHAPDQSAIRLCIDTAADLQAMRAIMAIAGADCTWRDAVKVLDSHPEIARLNQRAERNASYLAQVKEEQKA
jgi:spore coat polysaccharide biosynthesis protein SpsF (cytidylyltransferase family)